MKRLIFSSLFLIPTASLLSMASIGGGITMIIPFDGDPQKAREYIKSGQPLDGGKISGTIQCNKLDVFKVLVEEGGVPVDRNFDYRDPIQENRIYFTPLQIAAHANAADIIHYLVAEKKVDPNVVEPKLKQSAVQLAALSGKIEALKALLSYDTIDLTLKDRHGRTIKQALEQENYTGRHISLLLIAEYENRMLAAKLARLEKEKNQN